MRTFPTTLLAVAVAAFAAAGCKSNKCCPPQQQTACAPQPQPYCAPQAPAYYPAPQPPSEAYVVSPPPSPSEAQISDMQGRALDAERKARELAEERARRAEDALKLASSSGGPSTGGWPAPGGGGDDQAGTFAEELRTRCDAEIVQSGNTIVIRMSDAFRSGSDQLKPDVKLATSLHAIADALMKYPNSQVAVIGHTDSAPIKKTKDKWTDNVHLSRARAEAVARVMTDKGVAASRVMVDGRGDVEPLVYPERSTSDRARNRRVEIHVRF